MHLDKKLSYKFKGSRDYVHGTDIFNSLKFLLESEDSSIDIKFNGMLKSNLLFQEGDSSICPKANIWITSNQGSHHYQLVESGEKITESYPYEEAEITEYCQVNKLDQSIHLLEMTKFTFIENLVAMHKHLLQELFPGAKGKWLFTRISLSYCPENNSLLMVKLVKNFNLKLVQSDIYIHNKKCGAIFFSIS